MKPENNKPVGNYSKQLSHADDSAAALLVEVLQGMPGRNFDIESIFLEQTSSGKWRWVLYEFLKAETIDPEYSHPNYYWHKNGRKFLSLWTVVRCLRNSGVDADLILVNYADDRTKSVKEMKVINILTNPEKILRRASRKEDGSHVLEIREHVVTTDTVLSFQEWKSNFRKFNKNKKGDTWDLLDTFSTESQSTAAPQPDLAPIEQAVEEKNAPSISAPICESCQKPFQPRFASAKNCLDCWKRKQRSPGVTELS